MAFQEHDETIIIIIGVFHQSMEMPTRLRELQSLSRQEISAIKRQLAAD